MEDLIDTFAHRLSQALTIRNVKPIELAELTKIDKSKISSYMSGRYKAKTDGLKIIADVLNVSPVWLMGYDVPMERQAEIKQSGSDIYYTDSVTKETHFITWPPHSFSREKLFVFVDEQFVFNIFNKGEEIPYEYYHIRVEDDSINLIAPVRKNTSCS